jgi:hypothetical protein
MAHNVTSNVDVCASGVISIKNYDSFLCPFDRPKGVWEPNPESIFLVVVTGYLSVINELGSNWGCLVRAAQTETNDGD